MVTTECYCVRKFLIFVIFVMLLLFKGNREWKRRPVEKHSKGPQINNEGKLEGQSFKQKDKDVALSRGLFRGTNAALCQKCCATSTANHF